MIPVVIAIVVLISGVGTAIASDRAKPGDTLFSVDQAVEKFRLALTFGETNRAKFSADIAQEREHERLELKSENKESEAAEADEHTNRALDNAIEIIDDVLAKQAEKGNDGAVNALTNVSIKLREIQDRHEAEDAGLTEAEAKIIGRRTNIKLEFNDQNMNYWIDATDEASIIASIKTKTNVTEDQIRAVLKIEVEGDDEDENENDNSNSTPPVNNNVNRDDSDDDESDDSNDNRNSNANGNLNTNRSDDDDESEDETSNSNTNPLARWQIEVRVENNQAKVETRSGSVEQNWMIGSADRASILADIATRTGLTTAQVESIWSFEVED